MPRFHLQACLIFALILFVGCGTFMQGHRDNDGPASYSIGDMPAEKHAPRSLESLTKSPKSFHANTQPPGQTSDPDQIPRAENAGQMGMNEVSLATGDDIHVETELPNESIDGLPQKQLPTILENADHPFSNLSPESLPTQNGVDNLAQAPDGQNLPIGGQTNRANSAPGRARTPGAVGPSPVPPTAPVESSEPQHAQDQTDSSAIKFVVKPAADPAKSIPPQLDTLFAQAKPVQTDQQNESATSEGEEPQANPEIDDVNAIKTVAYLQETGDTEDAETAVETDGNEESVGAADQAANSVGSNNQAVSRKQPKQLTWNDQIDQAVHQLKSELENSDAPPPITQQLALHLLQTINGTAAGEDLTIPELSESEKAFWKHQISALRYLLHADSIENQTTDAATKLRQTSRATEQLKLAVNQLANIASLQIGQCVFCNQVLGFGQFTPAKTEFVAGQQVLIYCEIENYALKQLTESKTNSIHSTNVSTSGQGQYEAEIRGEYSIVSSDNRVVFQHQYATVHDRASRRRQDFYMYFPLTLPKLSPGDYRLQLSIEDLIGNKIATPREPLKFRIVSRPTAAQPQNKTARNPRNRRPNRSP